MTEPLGRQIGYLVRFAAVAALSVYAVGAGTLVAHVGCLADALVFDDLTS